MRPCSSYSHKFIASNRRCLKVNNPICERKTDEYLFDISSSKFVKMGLVCITDKSTSNSSSVTRQKIVLITEKHFYLHCGKIEGTRFLNYTIPSTKTFILASFCIEHIKIEQICRFCNVGSPRKLSQKKRNNSSFKSTNQDKTCVK